MSLNERDALKRILLTRGSGSGGSSGRGSTGLTSSGVDGDGSGSSSKIGESVGDGRVGNTDGGKRKRGFSIRSSSSG